MRFAVLVSMLFSSILVHAEEKQTLRSEYFCTIPSQKRTFQFLSVSTKKSVVDYKILIDGSEISTGKFQEIDYGVNDAGKITEIYDTDQTTKVIVSSTEGEAIVTYWESESSGWVQRRYFYCK